MKLSELVKNKNEISKKEKEISREICQVINDINEVFEKSFVLGNIIKIWKTDNSLFELDDGKMVDVLYGFIVEKNKSNYSLKIAYKYDRLFSPFEQNGVKSVYMLSEKIDYEIKQINLFSLVCAEYN